jgi:uncharacterized membrane protein
MTSPVPSLVWGAPQWIVGASLLMVIAVATLLWSYVFAPGKRSVRLVAAALKTIALSALALILLEPLLAGTRPRPGANAFVILADNSQSLQIRDDHSGATRGEWERSLLKKDSPWINRLEQDYDVRDYVFDSHLRAVDGFESLTFDGVGSTLSTSLSTLARRFRGLPLAGILLVSDGNKTDVGEPDLAGLPPVYPVLPSGRGGKDLGVSQVSVTQANFEAAPVVVRADVGARGFAGQTIHAVIKDESGKIVERQRATAAGDSKPASFRFQFRPEHRGVSFYQVETSSDPIEAGTPRVDVSNSGEQTMANNTRLVVVDQGGGPYRVLYVSGRPNWEFKFLARAIQEDEQIQLVGLIRIAKRKPKFDFRDARSQTTSPLFDGFDNADADTVERQDQPVLIRLGTRDSEELRDGFPKSAQDLYQYQAIVLDDVEAAFFSPDQLALLRNFVSQRGGGLLMLGGIDSFVEGAYDRTPVGELLPVYLNRPAAAPALGETYRLELTREGWLQPWVRIRKTEDEERGRLNGMIPFQVLSQVGNAKPGAAVLSEVKDSAGQALPALVAQQFGKGHVAALLIGDLWRWDTHRAKVDDSDLGRSWRQTVRWLVGDVPGRVDVTVGPKAGTNAPAIEIGVTVRDPEYRPLDNAKVTVKIARSGGDELTLEAEPDPREAGTYTATYVTREPGAYRILATAVAPDGSAIGSREAGWAAQPAADEFARLEPNRDFLASIAAKTHGEVVDAANLSAFVNSLDSRTAPISEPWTLPLWHNPLYFLIAIAALAAEWTLRRVNGLA